MNDKIKLILVTTLTIVISNFLTGCVAPRAMRLHLETTQSTNINRYGKAAPLLISIYQLKQADKFKDADYLQLTQFPKKYLGDELIKSEQFILLPNTSKAIDFNVAKKAHFLGIIASYRLLQQRQWRIVKTTKDLRAKKTIIVFNKNGISLGKK